MPSEEQVFIFQAYAHKILTNISTDNDLEHFTLTQTAKECFCLTCHILKS